MSFDIDRLVENETAIGFDGRDLLAEVERLRRNIIFAYERGYRDAAHGRPLDTEEQTRDLRLGE